MRVRRGQLMLHAERDGILRGEPHSRTQHRALGVYRHHSRVRASSQRDLQFRFCRDRSVPPDARVESDGVFHVTVTRAETPSVAPNPQEDARPTASGADDARGRSIAAGRVPPAVGRTSACLWFLLLAGLYGRSLVTLQQAAPMGGASFVDWAPILSRACTLVFMLTLAWLMLRRLPALPTRTGALPRVVALVGTYGVWLAPFLPEGRPSTVITGVSTFLTLTGSMMIVTSIASLGRSFSIMPQARKLIVNGSYRFVRHPLYLAEELALLGILLRSAWYAAIPFFLIHLALQIRRMAFEEALLRDAFPGYVDYAKRTARLIPGVW